MTIAGCEALLAGQINLLKTLPPISACLVASPKSKLRLPTSRLRPLSSELEDRCVLRFIGSCSSSLLALLTGYEANANGSQLQASQLGSSRLQVLCFGYVHLSVICMHSNLNSIHSLCQFNGQSSQSSPPTSSCALHYLTLYMNTLGLTTRGMSFKDSNHGHSGCLK